MDSIRMLSSHFSILGSIRIASSIKQQRLEPGFDFVQLYG
jgi:hypothetical protein